MALRLLLKTLFSHLHWHEKDAWPLCTVSGTLWVRSPNVHSVPGLPESHCFLPPHSLAQHPPMNQSLPVTSLGEENTFLFHLVGKTGKSKCPLQGQIWEAQELLSSTTHLPVHAPASAIGRFLNISHCWVPRPFHMQFLLLEMPFHPDYLPFFLQSGALTHPWISAQESSQIPGVLASIFPVAILQLPCPRAPDWPESQMLKTYQTG